MKMSLFRINRALVPRFLPKSSPLSTSLSPENEEYNTTPQYPPILDLSREKMLERKKEAVYDEIKSVKTVEEKQIKLNMPRYYGFRSYMVSEDEIYYNDLSFIQHITRTHIIKNKGLPDYYNTIETDNIAEIRNGIEEALLMELDAFQKFHDLKNAELSDGDKENIITNNVVQQINKVLTNNLVQKYPHLFSNEVDTNPRLETAWYVGGINPPEIVKKSRRGSELAKKYENDPVDRLLYYTGSPSFTVRSELPLPLLLTPSEAENPSFDVPSFSYDPRVFGVGIEHRYMANIPGFWPGDSNSFGIISYLKKGHLLKRSQRIKDEEDNKNALDRQAVLSSYAWLHAQANFLGFTTFNDITYPLVTQTVITNGKEFNFFIYQLNTILLHSKNIKENPKRNICWSSESFKLYEEVKDGKIVGLNDETLSILVKLYSNTPSERLGVNLRPYLGQKEKIIADYQDDEKREWLEREYKFLVSNRPRFQEMPQIYSYEKIYKIDHETRQMDKRRRFFELGIKPQDRKLNDRLGRYIPRAHRPDLPRHKGKLAKEYWP